MFTGIITDIGTIESINKKGDTRMVIRTSYDTNTLLIGASISCSGACMTVVDKGDGWFAIDVSDESLSRTSMQDWRVGTKINLERALKVGDELGGHIMTGHVDGIAVVDEIMPVGDSHKLVVSVPVSLQYFVAEKGSVSLDGVSLTVNGVEGNVFWVNLIPHTWKHTTLGLLREGDELNMEIDVLARYIGRHMEARK
jgi:riboflavin synthase